MGSGFRSACATAIQKATKPAHNMPKNYCNALADLSRNEGITVTTADKGGKLVVLDSVQYGELCLKHLEDIAYEKVTSFGTGRSTVVLDGRLRTGDTY